MTTRMKMKGEERCDPRRGTRRSKGRKILMASSGVPFHHHLLILVLILAPPMCHCEPSHLRHHKSSSTVMTRSASINLVEHFYRYRREPGEDQQQQQQQQPQHRQSSSLSQVERLYEALSHLPLGCRSERGGPQPLPFGYFMLDTCARCYHYMPPMTFKSGARFSYIDHGRLHHEPTNRTVFANETETLAETFASISFLYNWQQCCRDALLCCLRIHQKYYEPGGNSTGGVGDGDGNLAYPRRPAESNQCPPTWDGWLCWPEFAQPGQMLERFCPGHIYLFHRQPPCPSYASKQCNANGSWWNEHKGREWTDYSKCAGDDIFSRRLKFSLITNVISICALVPALVIFNCYRALASQDRIRLHTFLFSSLLFYSALSAFLKWYILHTQSSSTSSSTLEKNSVGLRRLLCLLPSMLLRYFRSTNYLWMFNEAVYLHRLIKKAFNAPSLRPLIVVAYGLPLVTTTAYIVSRHLSDVHGATMPVDAVGHVLGKMNNISTTTTKGHLAETVTRDPLPMRRSIDTNRIVLKAIEHTLIEDLRIFLFDKYSFDRHHQQQQQHQHPSWMQHLMDIVFEDQIEMDARPTAEALAIVTSQCLDDRLRSQQPHHQCDNILATSETIAESSSSTSNSGDNCWLMPSDIWWHEWIINVPNFAILIINSALMFWLLFELYKKSMASCAGVGTIGGKREPISRTGSGSHHRHNPLLESNSNGNGRHESARPPPPPPTSSAGGGSGQALIFKQSLLVSIRAACLLFPLYGLHYLLIVYRPKTENCFFSEAYNYLSLSMDGLQGLVVALIFCFGNSEIREHIGRSFRRYSFVRNRTPPSQFYMTDGHSPG